MLNSLKQPWRLIPSIVDDTARTEPDREIFSVPRTSDRKDGWEKITFKEFADAVNRVAGGLLARGRPKPGSFPTIAYIGPNDVRYPVIMIACIKAGYKALFISPRNSHEGQMDLFDKTDCNLICYDASLRDSVKLWLQERKMEAMEVASVDAWMKPGPDEKRDPPLVPYTKSFEEAQWDPVVVLHTSGSTGFPKPVDVRVGMIAVADYYKDKPDWIGWAGKKNLTDGKRTFSSMPMFHTGGCFNIIIGAIYNLHPVAFDTPGKPPTPQSVLDAIECADVDGVITLPSILEELSSLPEGIKALKKTDRVIFGGGALGREAGDKLVRNGVNIYSIIGFTEATPPAYYNHHDMKLWDWFLIDSEAAGIDWRPVDHEGSDVFEQVFVRKSKEPGIQGIFYTFPELNEWSSKDMYKKHPILPNHWRYHGRVDNIIVFSNGEKLNPVTIEETVSDHPAVKSALVVGTIRFQPAMLLEPMKQPESEDERMKFIDDVWPLVAKANESTVAHGQIGRPYVTLTDPAKPFPRAGKGTIQRAAAVKLYAKEVDELYERVGASEGDSVIQVDVSSHEALTASIRELFRNMLRSKAILEPDTDFFSVGIDSLQVINAARQLRHGLKAAGADLPASAVATRTIYANPTPSQLASHFLTQVSSSQHHASSSGANGNWNGKEHANGGSHNIQNGHEQAASTEVRSMQAQLAKYTHDLPSPLSSPKSPPSSTSQTIILTGSTGALGSYLLDMLSRSPSVSSIICLNRGPDGGAARQGAASASRGLSSSSFLPKTTFLSADLSHPKLGLDDATYNRLLSSVDRIIHNAWPVNFNISLASFEPHIRGVRHLIDFSSAATRAVPIVFVSTVGSVDGWRGPGPVPEESVGDMSLPSTGYGRSKMVSSLMLEEATRKSGVPTAVVRVGQVAGPTSKEGVWNRQEWLPSLVASSLYLGALPGDLGLVDWTPIQGVAALVLEVAGVTAERELKGIIGYFHGVNPRTVEWGVLADAVREFYGGGAGGEKEKGGRIKKVVPMREWVALLEESAVSMREGDVARNPGVKLMDFYRGLVADAEGKKERVRFEMGRTMRYSETMAGMKAVTPGLMKNWCRQWAF